MRELRTRFGRWLGWSPPTPAPEPPPAVEFSRLDGESDEAYEARFRAVEARQAEIRERLADLERRARLAKAEIDARLKILEAAADMRRTRRCG